MRNIIRCCYSGTRSELVILYSNSSATGTKCSLHISFIIDLVPVVTSSGKSKICESSS